MPGRFDEFLFAGQDVNLDSDNHGCGMSHATADFPLGGVLEEFARRDLLTLHTGRRSFSSAG